VVFLAVVNWILSKIIPDVEDFQSPLSPRGSGHGQYLRVHGRLKLFIIGVITE